MDEITIKCELCNKDFKSKEAFDMHNKAKHPEKVQKEKKPLPLKKIRNWAIFVLVFGLIIFGIVILILSVNNKTIVDGSALNFSAPTEAIHWHPTLTIKINGKTQDIPQNIGMGSTHFPIHTHEDINAGVIHMENDRPTRKTVVLGYFFEIWGKKFSESCIFEYCTDKGELKMYVNGKENFEFEKYFMQDKDKIVIEFTSA